MTEQGCILRTFIRTSVFFAGRFTLSRSSSPVRNATHLRTFCFLRSYFCLWRDFYQPACPFAARLTLKTALNSHKAKLPTNLRTFCFKDHHYESFCLRGTLCPVTLAHQIFVFYSSLYFYTSDAFRPILALFTHFAYTNFFICILPSGIFFLALLMPLIGLSSEFNFYFLFQQSSPHLNYILLSNVYSGFEFP